MDFSDDVSIMFPTRLPTNVGLPERSDEIGEEHVTFIYFGDEFENPVETRKEIESIMRSKNLVPRGPFYVNVLGYDLFGPDEDILVVRLDSPYLVHLQRQALDIFESLGYNNGSSFPNYNPHVTIAYDWTGGLTDLPKLDRIILQKAQVW